MPTGKDLATEFEKRKRLFVRLIWQIVTYSGLFARWSPANSILFAGLIRQIETYFPDNQDFEKRGGSVALIFCIFCCENGFFGQSIHFLGQKSKIFMQWSLPFFQDPDYPAIKLLFAGLIRQIRYYLPEKIWQISYYLPD